MWLRRSFKLELVYRQCGQRCSFSATLDGEVTPTGDASGTTAAGCSETDGEDAPLERFAMLCCGDETRGFQPNRSLSQASFSGMVHSSSIRSILLSCSGSRMSVTATSRPMCFVRKCLRMLHLHGSVYGQCTHLQKPHFPSECVPEEHKLSALPSILGSKAQFNQMPFLMPPVEILKTQN